MYNINLCVIETKYANNEDMIIHSAQKREKTSKKDNCNQLSMHRALRM